MTSNVRIDIASEFSDKGFKAAQAATTSLDKAVNKLGKRLTAAFSAYKVAQFAKDSVKAFAQDQKAAAVLAKTLENVNQGYATDMVENYIHKTEALYGVLDDKLRPAFAQLVVATGDATKSQALLQTALDVSAGTGKDLESVTAALSKAYLGNVTALQRLGVGLSKADLQGKSFNQILEILNQNFAGQAATAADTYQGKIDRLNVAFKNMQETIGKGIIDALGQLNQDQGFNGVIDKMGQLATYISDVTVGLGVMVGAVQKLLKPLNNSAGAAGFKAAFSPFALFGSSLAKLGAKTKVSQSQPSVVTNFLTDMNKIAAATAKINGTSKTLLTTNKGITKEKQQQAALDALSLKYLQAQKIFNEEQIQIAAALQNKGLTAEDQLRLSLKKDILDLETAIQNKDVEGATKLAAKIELEYKQLGLYQAAEKSITSIASILNNLKPMDLININNLIDALNLLMKMNIPLTPAQQAQQAQATAAIEKTMDNIIAQVLPNAAAEQDVTSLLGTPFNPNVVSNYGVGNPNLQNVTVTIVDNTSGLIDVVTNATQQASANGVNTRLIRNTGGLNW